LILLIYESYRVPKTSRNNKTINYNRPNELMYGSFGIHQKAFSSRNSSLNLEANKSTHAEPRESSDSESRRVHFQKPGLKNQANQNEVAELRSIIKQQDATIEELREEVNLLKQKLGQKNFIIHEQESKIISQSQTDNILNLRDDFEIAHLVPRLRLCQQVFENNLQEYLFDSKAIMTKDEFLARLIEKLHIERNEDALILANYFIPNDCEQIKTWKVLEKIIQMSGPYRSFGDSDFIKLKETFEKVDEERKEHFMNKLKLLTENKVDHVNSKNFTLLLQASNIDFDRRAFIVLLLRKSKSISAISVYALKQVMHEIFEYGDTPVKEEEAVRRKPNENITKESIANQLRIVMVTYKVAQAFKAQRQKRKPVSKNRGRTMRKKHTQVKMLDNDVKDRVEKFINGNTFFQVYEKDRLDEPSVK
jgi:hypothetical protein